MIVVQDVPENEVKIIQSENDRQLLYGDCLDVLRKFPSRYFNLVYLDPPFNSKRFYHACFEEVPEFLDLSDKEKKEHGSQQRTFNDSWIWSVESEEIFKELTEKEPINFKIRKLVFSLKGLFPDVIIRKPSMLAYCLYMIQRLIEIKRVMNNTASIYLHCDPTASHYLKIIMDIIFGNNNFRNEIIWHYPNKIGRSCRQLLNGHDIILFYTKTNNYNYNQSTEEIINELTLKRYDHEDENGKYKIYNTNGKERKVYLKEKCGDDVWEINNLSANDKERLGYPTQKPETLIEHIIIASSNPTDVILDPFCGGGTTLDVAEKLNRKWVGIDSSEIAINFTSRRLSKYNQKLSFYHTSIKRNSSAPKEMASFYKMNDKEVEAWIRDEFNALEVEDKVGSNDKGIDGVTTFNYHGEIKKIGIQITIEKSIDLKKFGDFVHRIEKKYDMGLFFSSWNHTPSIEKLIEESGKYDEIENIDRIQMVSFEDIIINRKYPAIPGKIIPIGYKKVKQYEFKQPVKEIIINTDEI